MSGIVDVQRDLGLGNAFQAETSMNEILGAEIKNLKNIVKSLYNNNRTRSGNFTLLRIILMWIFDEAIFQTSDQQFSTLDLWVPEQQNVENCHSFSLVYSIKFKS